MGIRHSVDWSKTCINISDRLSGLVWKKDIAPVINLSERQIQHILTGRPLSVCKLCRDREKAGFIGGIKIGFLLSQEVNQS